MLFVSMLCPVKRGTLYPMKRGTLYPIKRGMLYREEYNMEEVMEVSL